MADVQIQQTPGQASSSSWVWAIVVLVLLAVVAWYLFAGRAPDGGDTNIDINTNPPAAPAPPANPPATPPPPPQ